MCSCLGVVFLRKYEEFIDRNVKSPIGLKICGSCRELIDRNLQGPLDPAIGNLSQLEIL
jgi:hypothetical protein